MALFALAPVVGFAGDNSCNALGWSDDTQLSRDMQKEGMSVRAIGDILILPVPYRILCGHADTGDIRFWESFLTHYGCGPETHLARGIRAWSSNRTVEGRRAGLDALRENKPDEAEALCTRVGQIAYPDSYGPGALTRLADELVRHDILPK